MSVLDMTPSGFTWILDQLTMDETDAAWMWRLEFCRRWFP